MSEHKFVYQDADGRRRTMITDTDSPEKFTVHTELVLDGILDNVNRMRESQLSRSVNKHLASVPMTIYEKSIVEQWDEDDWKRWLNDPQNAPFRVWQGNV